MTYRILEAEIILFIWLFSASMVSYSAMSAALAINSEASEFINIDQNQTGGVTGPEFDTNSSRSSGLEGVG